jgi:hypothetical protein
MYKIPEFGLDYRVATVATGIFGMASNDLWNPCTWRTIPVSQIHLKFAPAQIVLALVSNLFRCIVITKIYKKLCPKIETTGKNR